MGLLIDGRWTDRWYDTKSTGGTFVREPARFRDWVSADGAPGPSGRGGFKAEPGRYHLYVSLACPWAHRTLIFRRLKALEEAVTVSVVEPRMLENGWTFAQARDGTTDTVNGARYLHQVYTAADPAYSGRVTVPVLWDRERRTIVNNESAEIIRMLNSAFDAFTDEQADFYPLDLREEIDAVNAFVYDNVNNGVYRCGFATTQAAYDKAFDRLFGALDDLDRRLGRGRYLTGERLTEADWRLFTTLLRFDAVYFGHFKCNLRRIADYRNLSNYLRELYQHPRVAETVDFGHIKEHYYYSHVTINPTRIVPRGPALNLDAPHDRDRLPAAA
jgi:putative glutathione S-transferase